jgi:hypothetical protein
MTRRRLSAWLALFAMSLQAMWPLAAQAAPAQSVQVCTAGGATYEVPLPGAPDSQPRHQHCALCLLGGERPMAAPASPAVLSAAPAAAEAAQSSASAFVASDRIPAARPRAPPSIS